MSDCKLFVFFLFSKQTFFHYHHFTSTKKFMFISHLLKILRFHNLFFFFFHFLFNINKSPSLFFIPSYTTQLPAVVDNNFGHFNLYTQFYNNKTNFFFSFFLKKNIYFIFYLFILPLLLRFSSFLSFLFLY